MESAFLANLNAQRAAHGVGPLAANPAMANAAASWTQQMVSGTFLAHASNIVGGAPAGWTKVGENVGRGKTVDSLTSAFMNSSGHRRNILDPSFTHVGIAVMVHPNGRVYTTHRFAAAGAVAAVPAPVPVVPTAVPPPPTAVPPPPTAVPPPPTAVPPPPTAVPPPPTAVPTPIPLVPTAVPVVPTAVPPPPTPIPTPIPTPVPPTPTAVPVVPTLAPTPIPVTPTVVPPAPTAVPVAATAAPVVVSETEPTVSASGQEPRALAFAEDGDPVPDSDLGQDPGQDGDREQPLATRPVVGSPLLMAQWS